MKMPISFVWHTQPSDEVLKSLSVDPAQGLSESQAKLRLEKYGHNVLPKPKRKGVFLRIAAQLNNPLFYVLGIAGAITAFLGDYIDAAVIISMIVINVIIGLFQEGKASRAIEALQTMLSIKATLLREGEQSERVSTILVPGDIVYLSPGSQVPADLRLIRVKGLRINEAALTGESAPIEKHIEPVQKEDISYACMAYTGTVVSSGSGIGVVVETGPQTKMGRISALMMETPLLEAPLARRLNQFAKQITVLIVLLGVLTFGYGYFLEKIPPLELFLAVVGLAVAAIPEGLPAIVMIVLAIGTRFMVRHHVIVRRLPAVEALGSVTVICSDKTGTLTKNEMTAVQIILPSQSLEVTGLGYEHQGAFFEEDKESDPLKNEPLQALVRCAVLCNNAYFKHNSPEPYLIGDPMEGALLILGYKAKVEPLSLLKAMPRIDEIPFESEYRFMATLNQEESGSSIIFLKGAPEQVFHLCAFFEQERSIWQQKVQEAAQKGQRILALAYCKTSQRRSLSLSDMPSQFTFLGLVGFIDPPREEAILAVAQCQRAGLKIKMVTGDHPTTAIAIAQQLGLKKEDVIARASPEDKLQLVKALQAQGEWVAVTGDGVNDAPALRAADIGVAMGERGTDAAREASDLVLTDDNFATIAHAVRQGRVVYDNIKKSLLFTLSMNVTEAGVIVLAVWLGLPLPVTVGQILWVNLVIEMTLGFTLAFEPSEPDVMLRPPRSPSEPLITRLLVMRILYVSILSIVSTFIVFKWELLRGNSLDIARTAAVNMLVLGGWVYLLNVRRFTASALVPTILTQNKAVFIMSLVLLSFQLLLTYVPFMQKIFHTIALDGHSWCIILGLALVKFFAIELEKIILRKYNLIG